MEFKKKKHTNIPDGFPYSGEVCFLEGSVDLKDYLMGGFDNEKRDSEASKVLKKLMNKYGNPHCGRNRATFISKKFVIKFPLNDEGELNNDSESTFVSENTAKGKKITINGFTCLIQEKLNILDYPMNIERVPQWVCLIDCGQIGYDSKGNLKAYDFAENIRELTVIKMKFNDSLLENNKTKKIKM